MKKHKVIRIVSVLLLVYVTLIAVRPAYADTHFVQVFPQNYDWVQYGGIDSPCAFDVAFHQTGYERLNYWLDENGNLSRHNIDILGNLKLNMSANGKTVNAQFQGPISYTFKDDNLIAKSAGTGWLMTVPGYGKIAGGAGQWTETYAFDPVTGNWVLVREKKVGNIIWPLDWGPVCAYLAP